MHVLRKLYLALAVVSLIFLLESLLPIQLIG
jgi:hypothetical protein